MDFEDFVRSIEAREAGMSEAECRIGFDEVDTDGVIAGDLNR